MYIKESSQPCQKGNDSFPEPPPDSTLRATTKNISLIQPTEGFSYIQVVQLF